MSPPKLFSQGLADGVEGPLKDALPIGNAADSPWASGRANDRRVEMQFLLGHEDLSVVDEQPDPNDVHLAR